MSVSTAASSQSTPGEADDSQAKLAHVHDTLAAGLVFMLIANVGQRAIGFIRNLSLCRFLDESSLGLWALASSFFLLAAPLTVLGLPGTFGKLVESYRTKGQLTQYLRRIALVCAVSIALAIALLLWNYKIASEWILGAPASLQTVGLICTTLLCVILFNTSTELLNSLRRGKVVSKMHTLNSLSFTLFSVVGLLIIRDWRVILVAFAASSIVGILPGLKVIAESLRAQSHREGERIPHPRFWKRVFPFAASIWIMNLLANMFDVVDRYMLLHLADTPELGTAMVGQFHSARILPLLLTSLTLMLSSLLLPYLVADWEKGDRAGVARSLKLTLKLVVYLFFALSIGALVAAPFLFNYVLEGKYESGLEILPMALTHCCLLATATLLQNYFWCIEKGRIVGAILGIGLLVNVALNQVWVPSYGIAGAMAATTVAGVVILLATLGSLYRNGIKIDRAGALLSLLPLTLLCGPIVAMIFGVITFVVASRSNLVLSGEEKGIVDGALVPHLKKLKWNGSSVWHKLPND